MATMTNGQARNQWARPSLPHLYLMTMKPKQPASAA